MTIRHAQEGEKEMQLRLEAQKNDYESAIQRHLNFIDQVFVKNIELYTNYRNSSPFKTNRRNSVTF